MLNLQDVLEKLIQKQEEKAEVIKKLSDEQAKLETEIQTTDEMLELLNSFKQQILEDKKKLEEQYAEVTNSIKRKKATGCVSSEINKKILKAVKGADTNPEVTAEEENAFEEYDDMDDIDDIMSTMRDFNCSNEKFDNCVSKLREKRQKRNK